MLFPRHIPRKHVTVGRLMRTRISITPQDIIGFIDQAMDMFPDNGTMYAVTGSTNCNDNNGQIIDWRVGPGDSSSSAGMIKPYWLYLAATVGIGLSSQRVL